MVLIFSLAFMPIYLRFFFGLLIDMEFISTNYFIFFFSLLDFIGEICLGLRIIDSTGSTPFIMGVMALSLTVLNCVSA